MSRKAISFPVFSYRRIETPFDKDQGYRNGVAVVEVSDLPDLSKWRKINVRDPKLRGALPKAIRESFLTNDKTFVFLSRGCVLSVDSCSFNNAEGTLTIKLRDPDLHGLLDGGHNYEIIRQNRESLAEEGRKQYVKIEILEGFDNNSDLVDLVDARNSSNQVRDESLMNLGDEFELLKKVLKDQFYYKDIAFSEYEVYQDGTAKSISIREIISILMAMDADNFSSSVHPINTYRSKGACLKHFREHKQSFKRIYHLAPEILLLWDEIHSALPGWYNAARKENSDVSGGRFGKLKGVTFLKQGQKSIDLDFSQNETRYVIPTGFKYPILGAFRALLELKRGKYQWGASINPIEFMHNSGLGLTLAQTIGEFALDAQNPSKTGKSPLVWQSCYQAAELAYLRHRSK